MPRSGRVYFTKNIHHLKLVGAKCPSSNGLRQMGWFLKAEINLIYFLTLILIISEMKAGKSM